MTDSSQNKGLRAASIGLFLGPLLLLLCILTEPPAGLSENRLAHCRHGGADGGVVVH